MTGGHKDTGEHPVAVAALSRKRSQIVGIIAELEKQLAAHRADLVHIDNALRRLNSPISGDQIPARKPKASSGYFVHGELTRRIYEGCGNARTARLHPSWPILRWPIRVSTIPVSAPPSLADS